jgi:hypothetical protein
MHKLKLSIHALAVVLLLGCASVPHERMVLSRLYLGLSSPSGIVTPAQLDEFIGAEVAPRFPAFTRYAARGQWKDKKGMIIHENTEVIEIIHGSTDFEELQIHEIIKRYKIRFSQESVLLVEDAPHVEFNFD